MDVHGTMRPPRPYTTERRRWRHARAVVLERDGHRCQCCGKASWPLEIDHILRIKDGGAEWETSNLQALCRSCHSEKTARENATNVPGSAEWRRAIWEIRSTPLGKRI